MTREDTAKLLAIASTFDNRKPNPEQVIAWTETLAGLDPRDCAEAIREHYKESADYLMPAHIVARARTKMLRRREEQQVAEFLAIQNLRPENQGYVKAIEAASKEIGNEPALPPKGDRANECPWCKAKPGRPCVIPVVGKVLSTVHPSRLEVA